MYWWQFYKRLALRKRVKQSLKINSQKTKNDLILFFNQNNINFSEINDEKIKDYIKTWFMNVVPKDKQSKAKHMCLSNRKSSCYLWHAFSSGIVSCEKENRASELYDSIERGECIIIMNCEEIGFVIENAATLTSKLANQFHDIVITSSDYKWTYIHTHEVDCGPYFWVS